MKISTAVENKRKMTYQIEGDNIFFPLNRAELIDIAVGDTIEVKGFPGATYTWSDQDMEFMENNPDDDIFLHLQRATADTFKAAGIILKEPMK